MPTIIQAPPSDPQSLAYSESALAVWLLYDVVALLVLFLLAKRLLSRRTSAQ